MKNLCSSKSKGKIHPVNATTNTTANDAAAVLKLLPAALFALTAALAVEDKEVLAYLMLRSLAESSSSSSSSSSAAAEKRRRCRRVAGVHRPLFDCGCFDCYTSFWSRWDHSADRDVIHMAIEAFEEHLLTSEKRGKEKRKRNKKEEEKAVVVEVAEENKGSEAATLSENECFDADVAKEEAVSVSDSDVAKAEVEEEVMELAAVSGTGERRRGWADVVGMFNSRLWSLWSPVD